MTQHSEFSCASTSRKHLNAAFLHRLKKVCVSLHLHVNERLNDEVLGDFVAIPIRKPNEEYKQMLISLASRYGIGSDYIDVIDNEYTGDKEYLQFYLDKKKPYAED